jgi:hypothetical protein
MTLGRGLSRSFSRSGDHPTLSMFHRDAEMWAVGVPCNRLMIETSNCLRRFGMALREFPLSDIHYCLFLELLTSRTTDLVILVVARAQYIGVFGDAASERLCRSL